MLLRYQIDTDTLNEADGVFSLSACGFRVSPPGKIIPKIMIGVRMKIK